MIGVDLSRTYVKIVLTNLKLAVLKADVFPLNEYSSAEKTINDILFLIERMMQENAVSQNQILGIGVGTVGPLDREQGIMLNPAWIPKPKLGRCPAQGAH